MQRYLNEMTLQGDLVNHPCLDYFPDGTAVLRITLETRHTRFDQHTDEILCACEHHDAVLYGHQAEQVAWSLAKGDQLWLRGPVSHRAFRDGITGRQGVIWEVEARQIKIMSIRRDSGQRSHATRLWLNGR